LKCFFYRSITYN